MRIEIDTENGTVTRLDAPKPETFKLGDRKGFELVSQAWLRAGWDAKHVYTFTWFGRPIIQLPEDLLRIQEVIFQCRPTVIVETGVAHGGGCVFFASLLKLLHPGHDVRVIGVDIEIRPHNRAAIEQHSFSSCIDLVEGSSIEPSTLDRVSSLIRPDDRVMVVLDSCHTRSHVLAELRAYAPLVSEGCHLVATDGIMKDLVGAPRSQADWATNNPCEAARDFAAESTEFVLESPKFLFDESGGAVGPITYWPGSYLRKIART
jgi:cephalosporin hydroxylase